MPISLPKNEDFKILLNGLLRIREECSNLSRSFVFISDQIIFWVRFMDQIFIYSKTCIDLWHLTNIYIYIYSGEYIYFNGEFASYYISWNAIALLMNWVDPEANNIYVKDIYARNFFIKAKNDNGSGVWCPTDVKSAGFWSQHEASCMSSHTEELWYNETVCWWMTIHIYIYV